MEYNSEMPPRGLPKILWIIPFTTYEKIPTAGGQTLYNYYLAVLNSQMFEIGYIGLSYSDSNFELMRSSFSESQDFSYSSKRNLFNKGLDFLDFKVITPVLKYFSPSYFVTNSVVRSRLKLGLKICLINNFVPDLIITEFTHSSVLIDLIKKKFPNSKYIATAHDLFYINVKRQFQNIFLGSFYSERFRKYEFEKYRNYDYVITNSYKDYQILKQNKLSALFLSPYYSNWESTDFKMYKKNGILFWGALYRTENVNSIFWFLKNVWSHLLHKFPNLIFYLVGSGLSEENKKIVLLNKNVCLTGFVDNPSKYFASSYCMVAPLFQGAGIKVKILEAMKANLAVVTTDVGSEGINIINNKHFLLANNSSDMVQCILKLIESEELREKLTSNAKKHLLKEFNFENSAINLVNKLTEMTKINDYGKK